MNTKIMSAKTMLVNAVTCTVLVLAMGAAHAATSIEDHEYFRSGEKLTSANGKFFAAVQTDGNFCVYPTTGGGPRFCAHNQARAQGAYYAVLQRDGNFCVYAGSGPVVGKSPTLSWCGMSKREEGTEYRAVIQDDGNFAVYGVFPSTGGGKLTHVWSTVAGNDSKNAHGGSLPSGKFRFSCLGQARESLLGLGGFIPGIKGRYGRLSPADRTRFDTLAQQFQNDYDVLKLPQHHLDVTLEARCKDFKSKLNTAYTELKSK